MNPIEGVGLVLEALSALRRRWADDPALAHPRLSRPDVVPTVVRAGDWPVTIPGACELVVGAMFLPSQAAADGLAGDVEREVEGWVTAWCAERDEWLAEHPPGFAWQPSAVMPYEIPDDGRSRRDRERPRSETSEERAGSPASTRGSTARPSPSSEGIPAIGLGPGGLGRDGAPVAHAVDEHVAIDDLVATAQALAVAALRFCGTR